MNLDDTSTPKTWLLMLLLMLLMLLLLLDRAFRIFSMQYPLAHPISTTTTNEGDDDEDDEEDDDDEDGIILVNLRYKSVVGTTT